jgi:hypothetical protein
MTQAYRPELHPVTFVGGATGEWNVESVSRGGRRRAPAGIASKKPS